MSGQEIKGNIGSASGPSYDLTVDATLNICLTVAAVAPAGTALAGASNTNVTKIPLAVVMDALAASSKNGTIIMAEGFAKQILEAYEAAQVVKS